MLSSRTTQNNIIALLGPTASGKTALSAALAPYVGGAVYADTASLYKDLNIGAAKPGPAEQAALPHYLINRLNLEESWNAADFVREAEAACRTIQKSGKPALLTGGSLFYIKNFLYGLPQAPAASPKAREKARQTLEELGPQAFHMLLQQADPVSAARIHARDTYRTTRAYEVFLDSGQPLSSFAVPQSLRPDRRFFIITVELERSALYERINRRVEAMWQAGLPQEAYSLKQRGARASHGAMKAIGYAEFFIENLEPEQIKELIKQNSRHYAKRQIAFLKKLPCCLRIGPNDTQTAIKAIQQFMR